MPLYLQRQPLAGNLLARRSLPTVRRQTMPSQRISLLTRRRETRPIPLARTDIEQSVDVDYWQQKISAKYQLLYIAPVKQRFVLSREERDAVLSVIWQKRPRSRNKSAHGQLYIAALPGVKNSTSLVYEYRYRPKKGKRKASLEVEFISAGTPGSKIKFTPSSPGIGYHQKTYVDIELEKLQSRRRGKLGKISGLKRLPVDEVSSVKYMIWQYFDSGKVRKSELDVIIPIAHTKRSVYYTLRFDSKHNNINVERLGEASKVKPGQIDIARVQGYKNHASSAAQLKSWLKLRYPGVSISGKTLAQIRQSINQAIGRDAGKPDWFKNNYQINILNATAGAQRMQSIYHWSQAQRANIKNFTAAELVKLEFALQTMSLPLLAHLRSLCLVRQDVFLKKRRGRYVAQNNTQGYTLSGKGGKNTVLLFDSFTSHEGLLFSGGSQGVRSVAIETIEHELGHVISMQPHLASKFRAFVKAHTIGPVSWYGATKKKEQFPEAFAFYQTDPQWMKLNLPKLFNWFETLSKTGKPP